MTPYELLGYYASLLILQYVGKPRANATIRALAGMATMPQSTSVYMVTFIVAPNQGVFVLGYQDEDTAAINWNDDAATIQMKLRALTGLGAVTVTGSIAGMVVFITMNGIVAPAAPIVVISSTLKNDNIGTSPLITEDGDFIVTESGERIDTDVTTIDIFPTATEFDETIPIAVMNAFNLLGPNPAVGVQLDVIGKYVGVTRSAFGFFQQITLDDADFLSFIKIAAVRNNSGSSLADIEDLLNEFFPGQILVFDYQDMHMDYMVSVNVGSQSLIQLFITEGLLPKPMGVQLGLVIYIPNPNNVFGFRTYETPGHNVTPFNNYTDYHTDWPWLSYSDAIITG